MRILREGGPAGLLAVAIVATSCALETESSRPEGHAARPGSPATGSGANSSTDPGGATGSGANSSTDPGTAAGSGASSGSGSLDPGGEPHDCTKWLGANSSSEWISVTADGRLAYKTLPKGEHLIDFSHAGYGGGGVPIPKVAVVETVNPADGDDTARIQSAIDAVSRRPLVSGVRGAVLLAAGTYEVSGSLSIATSGIVLRGSGSGTNGSVINLTGAAHLLVKLSGSGTFSESGSAALITEAYVPSGAQSFTVNDASGFSVGDAILVKRPVSQKWIDFMHSEPLIRNGQTQTWMTAGQIVQSDRVIAAIDGNKVTLDAPLTDTIDKEFEEGSGANLVKYTIRNRITNVGVESLRVIAPPSTAAISQPKYRLVELGTVQDAWVSDLVAQDTVDSFIVRREAKRVTIQDVVLNRSVKTDDAAAPADFGITGSQILIQRSESNGDDQFSLVTHERVTGPNVALQFTGQGTGKVQPHRRWATGLLIDSASFPNGGLDLMNRGTAGDGHGWAIGWGVIWNGVAKTFLVQQPPGAANWCIGCQGTQVNKAPTPIGILDSPNVPVTPSSLYLAQLCTRLGRDALKNIGY